MNIIVYLGLFVLSFVGLAGFCFFVAMAIADLVLQYENDIKK